MESNEQHPLLDFWAKCVSICPEFLLDLWADEDPADAVASNLKKQKPAAIAMKPKAHKSSATDELEDDEPQEAKGKEKEKKSNEDAIYVDKNDEEEEEEEEDESTKHFADVMCTVLWPVSITMVLVIICVRGLNMNETSTTAG